MSPATSVSAPASLTMNRANARSTSNADDVDSGPGKAAYHAEMAVYRQSAYRTNCAKLGRAAVCAGCLGCTVAIPLAAPKIAWDWTALTMAITSICCCINSLHCYDEANIPERPGISQIFNIDNL